MCPLWNFKKEHLAAHITDRAASLEKKKRKQNKQKKNILKQHGN